MKKGSVNDNNGLAKFRTILANDRTLLAYVRTMLSFLILGVGLIALFDKSSISLPLGVISIVAGFAILIFGFVRHGRFKKVF